MMYGQKNIKLCSGQRKVAGSCECGDEPPGFMKFGKLPDQLKSYYLLNMDSVPWRFRLQLAVRGFYLQLI
jgi:hypothetical protein